MSAVLGILLLIILITYAWGGYSAAPWVPCRSADVERIVALAQMHPGEKVYEIGCGDGRILFALAQRGIQASGCEISVLPFLIAKIKLLFTKGLKPTIEYKNFWNVPLTTTDLVIVFLTPQVMDKLRAKLERELKPGARVLCYVFPMHAWNPIRQDKPTNQLGIYLYSPKNPQG